VNTNDITTKLSDLVTGSAGGYPLLTMAGVALVWAIAMALTPGKLRILPVLYGVLLVGIFYTHHLELLPWPLAGGVAWALLMYVNPFKSAKKA
jgi:hypothetical protein